MRLQGRCELLFVVALLNYERITTAHEKCMAIHSKSWGIELTCCGLNAHLPETCDYYRKNFILHHCPYAPGASCACSVSLDVDYVQCEADVPVPVWTDHYSSLVPNAVPPPYLCRNPNFPNAEAEFSASIRVGSRTPPTSSLTSDFLLGLSRYKVSELELSFGPFSFDAESSTFLPDNFFTYFRHVNRLKLIGYDLTSQQQQSSSAAAARQLKFPTSFATLKQLKMLTIKNFTDTLFPSATSFSADLLYVQIYQCRLSVVPEFVDEAHKLEYLKIQHTNIDDVKSVGRLRNLKLCFLSRNKIRDLTTVTFANAKLTDLDLSYNKIETLAPETFASLPSLIFLDLSNNPLIRLPGGSFVNLKTLRWLYLSHDDNAKRTNYLPVDVQKYKTKASIQAPSLNYLSAQHFVGLENLQYLSLSNNPSLKLDHSALKPLVNLEKLDLQNCNLTALPESLSDLCKLKYLRINGNKLRYDSCFLPHTYVYVAERANEIDVNENGIDEIPKSFFLTPIHKTTLIESLVMALKQQPVWWQDKCCAFYWRTYLIDDNQNDTFRSFYSSKFGLAFNQTGVSSLSEADRKSCLQRYTKMTREIAPFRQLGQSGACQALKREKTITKQLKRQLRRATGHNSPSDVKTDEEYDYENPNRRNSPNDASDQSDQYDYYAAPDQDSVVFIKNNDSINHPTDFSISSSFASHNNGTKQEVNSVYTTICLENPAECRKKSTYHLIGRRGPAKNGSYELRKSDVSIVDECRNVFDRTNFLGYLLAANFVVLFISFCLCVITVCKRR